MPDPSVQPPEGLRKIAAEALRRWQNSNVVTFESGADAVLVALFDACEVRVAYCTRYGNEDVHTDYPADSAKEALLAARRATFSHTEALTWLVIETSREPVPKDQEHHDEKVG